MKTKKKVPARQRRQELKDVNKIQRDYNSKGVKNKLFIRKVCLAFTLFEY